MTLKKLTFEESAEMFSFSSRQAFWQWLRNESERWTATCDTVQKILQEKENEVTNPYVKVKEHLMKAVNEIEILESNLTENDDEELD